MTATRKPTTSTALARTLTDSVALPALIEKLEPGALQQLVEAIGIEDSGALISHASPTQIAHLVDESIWASARPGEVDSLSVPELLKWFDLWLDIGETFAAEKLFDLGEEFCALALAKLVVVGSLDPSDGLFESIGGCRVGPRFDDEWDTVKLTLLALWLDYPDFTEAVLNRLDFQHSILRMTGEDDLQSTLEEDAGFARESRKEAQGFVGAATATAFLIELRHADIDELVQATAYDAHTQAYFARRRRIPVSSGASGGTQPSRPSRRRDDSTDAELDALQTELDNYHVLVTERTALLTGPEQHTARGLLPVRQTLSSLVTEIDQFAQHSDELVYLSNLVKAQVVSEGNKLSPTDAANLVMATANLGGSYLLWLDGVEASESDPAAYVELLATPAGMVRLFRLGWTLLSQLPAKTASRITEALIGEHAGHLWKDKAWLTEEIELLVNDPSLVQVVASGDYEAARETLKILAIALPQRLVSALSLLVDQVPRISKSVLNVEPSGDVQSGAYHIAYMQDLVVIDRFLSQIEMHLKT